MDQQIAQQLERMQEKAVELRSRLENRVQPYRSTLTDSVDPYQEELNTLEAQIEQLSQMGERLAALKAEQYDLRQEMNAQRRGDDPLAVAEVQKQIFAVQREIVLLTEQVTALTENSTFTKPSRRSYTRGAETTGLVASLKMQMAQVPIAYAHLLDAESSPLLRCQVKNVSDKDRRIRVIAFVEGYSAQSIVSVELGTRQSTETSHLPTFFPTQIANLRELTRATLNVLIEDLDTTRVEIHQTQPVWLLARNSAPLSVRNPATGAWVDLSRYLGAFVTPHQLDVEAFLRQAVTEVHGESLSGYQAGVVTAQVAAIYNALQKHELRYVNSVIDFAPDESAGTQRVRLPRETLQLRTANCIDGTLLFASLLESVGINPALVIVPGHAFVAWSTRKPTGMPGSENNDETAWDYLETTYLGAGHDFDEARQTGKHRAAAAIEAQRQADEDPARQGERWFRRWSLRELRARHNITPME